MDSHSHPVTQMQNMATDLLPFSGQEYLVDYSDQHSHTVTLTVTGIISKQTDINIAKNHTTANQSRSASKASRNSACGVFICTEYNQRRDQPTTAD